jgi:hypothetical protein
MYARLARYSKQLDSTAPGLGDQTPEGRISLTAQNLGGRLSVAVRYVDPRATLDQHSQVRGLAPLSQQAVQRRPAPCVAPVRIGAELEQQPAMSCIGRAFELPILSLPAPSAVSIGVSMSL